MSSPLDVFKGRISNGIAGIGNGALDALQQIKGLNYSDGGSFKITIIFLLLLAISSAIYSAYVYFTWAKYSSKQCDVNTVITDRRQSIGTFITPTNANSASVCSKLSSSPIPAPYNSINLNGKALVNWRPLTVRLAGYLGGVSGVTNGVFDMEPGIKAALHVGTRCFIFDIDYLENTPCIPRVMFRDINGVDRALNTGDITLGFQTLTDNAFKDNSDPVIIVIYLNRIPPGKDQQKSFFSNIALAFQKGNISKYYLTTNSKGNFFKCSGEPLLFTNDITDYQNKFIVLCNYDVSKIVPINSDPKNNLWWWTNARIYKNPKSTDSRISAPMPETGQTAYACIGSTSDYLNIPGADESSMTENTSNKFNISIGPPDQVLTAQNLDYLLNTIGIQSVPIDVIGLAMIPSTRKDATGTQWQETLSSIGTTQTVADLSTGLTNNDLLSHWRYAGWSYKNVLEEGFENPVPLPVPDPIPGFIRPKPVIPKKPSPALNSNGGLVSIQ
jgi:hypothetical protein